MMQCKSSVSASSLSTLPWFLGVVLLWSLAFGGMEYLLKNFSLEPLHADPAHLLEDIVGYMSIGSVLAYGLGGAVSSMGRKRTVIVVTGLLSILVLLAENLLGWSWSVLLIVSAVLLGFLYGFFAVVRSILVSIEILKTQVRETVINGLTNALFTSGIIASTYVITRTYEIGGVLSLWTVIGLIVLTCLLAVPLRYDAYEARVSPLESLRRFSREMLWIARRMYMVLLPSASLWGIMTVIGVWALPYAQKVHGISESRGSLILLFSALGVIVGNILTMRVHRRWLWFRVLTYLFAALVAGFHVLTSTFALMIVYATVLGTLMGAATNLIDSYYLRFIGEQGVKENGAALGGLATNGMVALLLFVLKSIPESRQALFLGIVAVAMGIFVRLKLKTIKGYEHLPPATVGG